MAATVAIATPYNRCQRLHYVTASRSRWRSGAQRNTMRLMQSNTSAHALMLAPAPACENLYYPSTTGHIFATPNQHARMRLPFLGMVILASGAPIEVRQ